MSWWGWIATWVLVYGIITDGFRVIWKKTKWKWLCDDESKLDSHCQIWGVLLTLILSALVHGLLL